MTGAMRAKRKCAASIGENVLFIVLFSFKIIFLKDTSKGVEVPFRNAVVCYKKVFGQI
jgi:hypothetical protein